MIEQSNLHVYWHDYAKVVVQRCSGHVSYMTLANALNELSQNIGIYETTTPINIIIDTTDLDTILDPSVFSAAKLQRLMQMPSITGQAGWLVIVDPSQRYILARFIDKMMAQLGYRLQVVNTYKEAVEFVEVNQSVAG